ncbi:hypothetical protein FHG87_008271 [Trinorchestia longiramus]|nr:hypothetical protein FHG87_008271 [Trinorchestia longiramus]
MEVQCYMREAMRASVSSILQNASKEIIFWVQIRAAVRPLVLGYEVVAVLRPPARRGSDCRHGKEHCPAATPRESSVSADSLEEEGDRAPSEECPRPLRPSRNHRLRQCLRRRQKKKCSLEQVSQKLRSQTSQKIGSWGQSGGFCGQNGGFCGQNGGFCGQNGGFCGQNGGFCGQNGGFCGQNGGFCADTTERQNTHDHKELVVGTTMTVEIVPALHAVNLLESRHRPRRGTGRCVVQTTAGYWPLITSNSPNARPTLAPRSPHARPTLAPRSPHARPTLAPRSPHARPTLAPSSPQARPKLLTNSPTTSAPPF